MPQAVGMFPDKRAITIAVGVFVATLAIVGFLVGRAWLADRDLSAQAAQAGSSKSAAFVDASSAAVDGDSGNVAAGGIVTADGKVLYEASTDGVFYRAVDNVDGGSARKLVDGGAYGLNIWDGHVYYLEAAADGRASFEGVSIKRVAEPADDATGLQIGETVYNGLESGNRLSCLTITSGSCYFLERSGKTFDVKCFALEGPGSAETLASVQADSAWLFVADETAYLVACSQGSWYAKRANVDASQLAFTEVAKGTSSLATVAVSGGKLYYALSSDAGDVHLQRADLKGGVIEYADLANPVRIAASGDVVVVMTKDGRLVWADAATSVAHDLTKELRSCNSNIVAGSAALGVCGEWVCVADGRDGYCRLNVNDGNVVGTV